MANLYNYSSSSCPQEPDDISVFLQQILLRSSSSSSSSSLTRHHSSVAALSNHLLTPENQEPVPGPGQIHAPDPCPGLNSSSGCRALAAANVSSSSVGNLDNEPDEYDYESEEAVEAMAEETVPKRTPGRSSSKRSRAAEVHNLSEKRRRSRINEKMKALQNLIPNSNKTDKASMLDEAIEYLKQLQLQVQMLTMRNGLSLYPICLPETMLQPNQISQPRMEIYDTTDKFLTTNMSKSIPLDQNISANEILRLQDNCVKQAPLADFSTMMGSKTLYKVEASKQDHYESLDLSRSSREKILPCRSLNEDCPPSSLTGTKATSSIAFETRTSHLKDNALEACLAGGEHLLANFVNSPIFSSQLNM